MRPRSRKKLRKQQESLKLLATAGMSRTMAEGIIAEFVRHQRAKAQHLAARLASRSRPIAEVLSAYTDQLPTEKQREFLELDCFEALYGGSAGGGKSSCLLMGAIHIAACGGKALVLRRSFADLSLPGAIMQRAQEWLDNTDAVWNYAAKRFTFPSGGNLQFGYLESEQDKYRYQGAEFHGVFFDELTQFTEAQYTYLLSRIRKASGDPVPLMVRSSSNPGGIGHDWVYRRFIAEPEARIFIPARLADNPHIEQDAYRSALMNLDEITRAQLLDGVWVRNEGGQLYRFGPSKNIGSPLEFAEKRKHMRFILGIDLGASAKDASTAFCVVAYSPYDPHTTWVVKSEGYADLIPSTVAEVIKDYQTQFSFESIVCDAGALGRGYVEEFRRRHSLPVRFAEKGQKLSYRHIINGDFERGQVKILVEQNKELVEELETIQWDSMGMDSDKNAKDHLSDAMLYAYREAKTYAAREKDIAPIDPTERAAWEAEKMRDYAAQQTRERMGIDRRGRRPRRNPMQF